MINRRSLILATSALGATALLASCNRAAQPKGALRIGLVVKSLGNNFFNAVHKGADEAAAQLGQVEVIFTGPPSTTAEGQIEVINALIAQHVDAIAISANDPDALVPSLKKAMERGVKVISYDSGVAKDGRLVHLAASSEPLIGQTLVDLAKEAAPNGGKIAILSATPTSTNQNAWIAEMKKALAGAPTLNLVGIVYGDDLADKSYRETVTLLKQHPDLAAIVAPSSVGIVAAAKAVEDNKAVGKTMITGLGLPSELAGHVAAGSVKSFALWNPIDLGYAALQLAVLAARGEKLGPGATAMIGRMGSVTFDQDGVAPMAKPFNFNTTNIAEYAKLF